MNNSSLQSTETAPYFPPHMRQEDASSHAVSTIYYLPHAEGRSTPIGHLSAGRCIFKPTGTAIDDQKCVSAEVNSEYTLATFCRVS
jgi:peptidase E